MPLIDAAIDALFLAFNRAADMAVDPANAYYTGGIIAVGLAIIAVLRRGGSRPGSI